MGDTFRDKMTKRRRIGVELIFVILSVYGILYGTLVVTYVGQYVENKSLMYEPRVRNRHVAPEKMDTLLSDGHLFFFLINKEGLMKET